MERAEIEALAASLRLLLASLDAGETVSSVATRYRLEGAIAALDAVIGRESSLLTGATVDGLRERPTAWPIDFSDLVSRAHP